MLEMKLTIEAPDLSAALNNLASAIGGAKPAFQLVGSYTKQQNAPAPVQQPAAPVQNPQPMAPAPAQQPAQAPVQQPPIPVQQFPGPAPVAPNAPVTPPVASVPLAPPPQYTVDQIMAAGATLMDAGKVNDLMNLLHSFGVQAVMDLKPEQLGAFATEMRKLGAKI